MLIREVIVEHESHYIDDEPETLSKKWKTKHKSSNHLSRRKIRTPQLKTRVAG